MNAARGGIVDEQALHSALKEGRVGRRRPRRVRAPSRAPTRRCSSSRTSSPPRTWARPPTRRRRRPVSRSPSRSGSRCRGELVPDAVNVQGGVIAEDVRPGIALTEKLGRIFTALAGGVAQQLDVEVRGEITQYDVKVLELAALKGVFARCRRGQRLLRERAAARGRARSRGPARHRPRQPGAPQPDHPARHARRRRPGVGVRHAGRRPAVGAAGRGRRVRPRDRAVRRTWPSSPTRTGRASSARSAASSATPRSTSPACRSAATARAARRWSR